MSIPKKTLVGFDGSPESERAFEYALELPDAELTLVTVIDPFDVDPERPGYQSPIGRAGMPAYSEEWYEGIKRTARERIADAQRRADEHGVAVSGTLESGRPARAIVRCAGEDGFDHVVVGSHGRSGISRVLYGSVSESVVRRSPVPVTVVQ